MYKSIDKQYYEDDLIFPMDDIGPTEETTPTDDDDEIERTSSAIAYVNIFKEAIHRSSEQRDAELETDAEILRPIKGKKHSLYYDPKDEPTTKTPSPEPSEQMQTEEKAIPKNRALRQIWDFEELIKKATEPNNESLKHSTARSLGSTALSAIQKTNSEETKEWAMILWEIFFKNSLNEVYPDCDFFSKAMKAYLAKTIDAYYWEQIQQLKFKQVPPHLIRSISSIPLEPPQ
jgi:hypothetical protein